MSLPSFVDWQPSSASVELSTPSVAEPVPPIDTQVWGGKYAKDDLDKSGLTPTTFPIDLGINQSKHRGLEYYKIKYPGSDYVVDRLNSPNKDDRYRFMPNRKAEVYWPTSDGGHTNCREAFKTALITAAVEGQKKSAKWYATTQVPAAGLPGCFGWGTKVLAVSKHIEHTVIRDELLVAQGAGHLHFVLMDGDWATNSDVAAALGTYVHECKRYGTTVIVPDFGYDSTTKQRLGFDDWYMKQFGWSSPSQTEVIDAVRDLPQVDTSLLPLMKSFYTATLDRFNRGYDDFTDRGNATFLLRIYGEGNIRYLVDTGEWAVYGENGTNNWTLRHGDSVELVNAAALQRLHHAEMLFAQYRALTSSGSDTLLEKYEVLKDEAEALYKSYQHLSGNRGRSAVLDDLKTRHGVVAKRAMFDSVPDILHVPSGIVDLNTGVVRPEIREDYVLNVTKADYTGGEPTSEGAGRIKQFMVDVTSGTHGVPDPEMYEYFMRRQGASLRFGVVLTAIEILHGRGSTGRSAWARCDEAMLGDYAVTVPAGVILSSYKNQNAEGATPQTVRLKGARKVFMHESKDTAVLDEAKVKQMTGGDNIAARGNYRPGDQFANGATPILLTNNLPRITNLDPATLDRLAVTPFRCRWNRPDKVVTAVEDADLPTGDLWFIDEAFRDQGVLNWLLWAEIQAGVRWKQHGLGKTPAALARATIDYTEDQDFLAQWLAQSTFKLGPITTKVRSGDLYLDYQVYCAQMGMEQMNSSNFSKRLTARFSSLTRKVVAGKPFICGITLKTPEDLQRELMEGGGD